MEERIALVGIVVEDPDSVERLNAILHDVPGAHHRPHGAALPGGGPEPHQRGGVRAPGERHQRPEREAGDAPRRVRQDRLRTKAVTE